MLCLSFGSMHKKLGAVQKLKSQSIEKKSFYFLLPLLFSFIVLVYYFCLDPVKGKGQRLFHISLPGESHSAWHILTGPKKFCSPQCQFIKLEMDAFWTPDHHRGRVNSLPLQTGFPSHPQNTHLLWFSVSFLWGYRHSLYVFRIVIGLVDLYFCFH